MRTLLTLILALALAACAAPPAPTEPPTQEAVQVQPTQTPIVVVETVVVTVIPTDMPTDVPTAMPTATPLPPTDVASTQLPAPTTAPVEADSGLVSVDNTLGGGWFSDMSLTANTLSLRCQLYKQVTFSVKPMDPNISQVDFYYRIQDKASGAVFDWQGPRRMLVDANGIYTLAFSGEDVHANFRKPNAWFDFQFVGLSKGGGRIGNSEKIVQQVNYTFDCP